MKNKLPTAKKTKKKFYNKYIYKVSLNFPGISGLRYFDLSKFLEICQTTKTINSSDASWKDKTMNRMIEHKDIWVELIPFINSYEKNTYSKRLEGDNIDFYTNDKSFYDGLCDRFGEFVRLRFQPPKGLEKTLLEEEKKIFVKQFPHGIYQYKAFLHPHKIPQDDKRNLVEWLEKQTPNITFTPSIKRWVLNTTENWDRRYIYVKNEQTLLMIKLRTSSLLGQVFKYKVIR